MITNRTHAVLADAAAYRATLAKPSAATLDRIADRAISGGYKITPKAICPTCRVARFANGTCMCDA